MKTRSSQRNHGIRRSPSGNHRHQKTDSGHNGTEPHSPDGSYPYALDHEIRVFCLYPSVVAGKLARQWLETALGNTAPQAKSCIEYFNFAVLNHDSISWKHIVERVSPDIILIMGDGNHMLGSGTRHSLRELLAHSGNGKKPMVLFRDLEPDPSINTRTLLDYVAALSIRNHCEFNAVNGNGSPISCFRHPQLLLKTRRHRE